MNLEILRSQYKQRIKQGSLIRTKQYNFAYNSKKIKYLSGKYKVNQYILDPLYSLDFPMSVIANYKIKKSKLLFRMPPETPSPYHEINDKQQKICQITYRSIRNSKSKYKTVNYKEYDLERKLQMENRKKPQRPVSLYLDGVNSPFQSATLQPTNKTNNKKVASYLSQIQQSTQNIQPKQPSNKRIQSPSKKSLKKIILKQIQLKNKFKNSPQHKMYHVDSLPLQTVEDLFILKQINKDKTLHSNNTHHPILTSKKSQQFAHSDKTPKELPAKNSVFSERNFTQKKAKFFNPQNQLSCVMLPSVEDKSNHRPLVYLEGNDSKKILAQNYIVFKHDQKKIVSGVAYKKNIQIASLTKIMTFYTILCICEEYSIDYKQRIVQICERAEQMTGTSAQIFSGQKYTLQNLFYGMMLPSGNDAAVAIANEGGSILKKNKNKKVNLDEQNVKCFIKYMNVLAKNIGMKTSNFANSHGLPNPSNLSNPYQLSLLLSQCLKFEEFSKVTGTKTYSFWAQGQRGRKKQVIWENTHKLLRRPGFIGGKTGVTVTAGPCLATIYQSKTSQIFIVVVLRASKLSRRFKETRWILGFTLKKLNAQKYATDCQEILKSNKELDSDNSEDEDFFDFKKADSAQMRKRNKILVYQM